MPDSTPASPPAPQSPFALRRFLRFRLRTLLILTPVLTFLAAYGLRGCYVSHMEAWAARQIEEAGGIVLRDEGQDVIGVQLQNAKLTDQKLNELLPALQIFPKLKTVVLAGKELTAMGVEPLTQLPALRELFLAGTRVTADDAVRLQKLNPALKIDVTTPSPRATKLASRPIYKLSVVALNVTAERQLVSGSGDGRVRLWNARRSAVEATLPAHTEWVFAVAPHPQLRLFATGGGDNFIKLWDPQTGAEVGRLTGHTDDVHGLAFTPDGRTLVSTGDDRTVRVWDVQSRRERFRLTGHTATVPAVAVSPRGDWAASGGRDDTVRFWNLATGESGGTLTGHTDDVMSLAYHPAGEVLASASYDRTLRLWNVTDRREIAVSGNHGDRVFGVRWSPDGTRLITVAGDGVRCFRGDDLQLIWHEDRSSVASAAVWLDNERLATASADGIITEWTSSGRLIRRVSAASVP